MISPNAAFVDELYFEYLKDPDSVSPEWRKYFENDFRREKDAILDGFSYPDRQGVSHPPIQNGIYSIPETIKPVQQPSNISIESTNGNNGFPTPVQSPNLAPYEKLENLSNVQTRISENMELSLEVPTATSTRTMPVKVLDENRRIINKYLAKLKRPKVSFTHLLAWAIVRSLVRYPHMNDTYTKVDGKAYRVNRNAVNFGLAVDITKKDGTRTLLVPNLKNAQNYNFSEFIEAFDNLLTKTRNNKLDPDDLSGTTVTLTNPGMIGTTASSPRLMKGQGLIVASGSIDYPTEFQAVRPEIMTSFAISKVVTLTNTYDHRITQGAESAEFLAYIESLLLGKEQFYDQIFASLKIPFEPIKWEHDNIGVDRFGRVEEQDMIEKGAHVMLMINAYRVRGHLISSINPLGHESYYYPELDPAYYGFTIWDLDRVFHADDSWKNNNLPLRDIIELVRETYCGTIGVEFMHIQNPEKKDWIKNIAETTRFSIPYSTEEKKSILKKLSDAEAFEHFLHTKFVGHKRFSLEGNESVIVLVDKMLEQAANNDLYSIVLGMAHRGRLNVLANNIGKSFEKIIGEFEGEIDPNSFYGSGDVKYHLGDQGYYTSPQNKTVSVILSPNPSHLELVDPVIEGMARALEREIKDNTFTKVLPILVHGDAAFAGQGIVAETLNMSQLDGYKTGGTIHIVINNQIGFTTSSSDARSTIYATDIAKMIQCPIIHVNGNDPEAVCTVAKFAYDYRNEFKSDVIIDILGYRKYGHNESDEPTYTQPLLYKKIKTMPTVCKVYQEELIKEKVVSQEEAEKYISEVSKHLSDIFDERKKKQNPEKPSKKPPESFSFKVYNTAVSKDTLRTITDAITRIPVNFKPNPKLINLMKRRAEMVRSEKPEIDWAMAEALAFGSLLLEGREIRFSGQDTRRGTFSQRHAVLTDMETEENYTPLNNIARDQAVLRIYDSPLSELSVVGFEYGYSVIADEGLTLWEAQFGDFANNAQSIVDQFLSCAEMKWGQTSNLGLLLPHGYDGQGPEHSSSRFERYLQLCAEDNMIVAYLTSPAQYFHLLRRQAVMKPRKPFILITPKSMLRHPLAVTSLKELSSGTFREIIDDETVTDKNKVKRLILCTGKIYYDLMTEMKEKREDLAVVRIEQLYPFNSDLLKEIIRNYRNAKDVIWLQEEPQNMGAWFFMEPRVSEILSNGKKLRYIGRKASAATATGSFTIHIQEQKSIIEEAKKPV